MDIVSGSFVVRKKPRPTWMDDHPELKRSINRSDVLTVDWDLIALGQHCGIDV